MRLLNRTTRRHNLTPEGERYLEDGTRILRDIDALEHALGTGREEPRGLLRVNATPPTFTPCIRSATTCRPRCASCSTS